MSKKQVTFADIAEYTHFSKSTISRYFNHPDSPIAKTAMDLLVRQMDEQKKRAPKPLGEPIHKQITPILIRRNTTQ